MKNIFRLFLIQTLIFTLPISAQNQSDSLVRFSDLKYHSDFEREAVLGFFKNNSDAFNLFLAIDETMSEDEAVRPREIYASIYDDLNQKNIVSKKINQKIKLSYSTVHSRFLKKYNENDYFPVIFQTGTYNCVSASMLYAIIFDELEIPYKVKASSNHVYLVANPGSNSIVIETTNPGFEKTIFTGEFKQQYVNYLRTSKLINDEDYKNKSVEEIFEEKYKEVRDAEFINLPGFQYYNKALSKFQNNDIEEALILSQKAYFFYPDNQVKTLLNSALLFQIEKCKFDRVSDIDYLAQLSRFENTDLDVITGIFNNIIFHQLQYTDKEAFCDSLYQRLTSQMFDKEAIDEIGFKYNMQMSYRYQNSDKVEKYVANALEIKGNHHDANVILENHLNRKLFNISNPYAALDTITRLELKYNYEMITHLLKEHKLITYLKIAGDQFDKRKITDGDMYLQEFENNCITPIESQWLNTMIESTYRSAAFYYFYKGNKSKAKSYLDRGLKYVPNSRLLDSVVF